MSFSVNSDHCLCVIAASLAQSLLGLNNGSVSELNCSLVKPFIELVITLA